MISGLNRKRKSFDGRNIIIVLGILVLIIFLGRIGFVSIGGGVFKPFIGIANIFKNFGDGFRVFFVSRASLMKEVEILKNEIVVLRADNLKTSLLESENRELKEILERKEFYPKKIVSKVLTKQNINVYGTIVIDSGLSDGVVYGAIVYAYPSIAIGRVVEVNTNTSLVQLFSASGIETSGRFSFLNLDVILHGRGGGSFAVYLPHNIIVDPNETVNLVSSKSFIIANVVGSDTDPRDPEQTIYLRTPINLNTLNFVEVEKNNF